MHTKDQWNEVCEAYLSEFCKRHGFCREDAWWIGDDPGGLAQIGDYFVGMNEIRYDVDNSVPEKNFFLWYDYDQEVREIECMWHELENFSTFNHLNYESFCKGAPRPYGPEKLEQMRESAERMRKFRAEFVKTCRENAR